MNKLLTLFIYFSLFASMVNYNAEREVESETATTGMIAEQNFAKVLNFLFAQNNNNREIAIAFFKQVFATAENILKKLENSNIYEDEIESLKLITNNTLDLISTPQIFNNPQLKLINISELINDQEKIQSIINTVTSDDSEVEQVITYWATKLSQIVTKALDILNNL